MRRNRLLYVVGLALGLGCVFALIPQARETARSLAGGLSGRARKAWEEGKKAKRLRENELEEEVLGVGEPGAEEQEAPDYIV